MLNGTTIGNFSANFDPVLEAPGSKAVPHLGRSRCPFLTTSVCLGWPIFNATAVLSPMPTESLALPTVWEEVPTEAADTADMSSLPISATAIIVIGALFAIITTLGNLMVMVRGGLAQNACIA